MRLGHIILHYIPCSFPPFPEARQQALGAFYRVAVCIDVVDAGAAAYPALCVPAVSSTEDGRKRGAASPERRAPKTAAPGLCRGSGPGGSGARGSMSRALRRSKRLLGLAAGRRKFATGGPKVLARKVFIFFLLRKPIARRSVRSLSSSDRQRPRTLPGQCSASPPRADVDPRKPCLRMAVITEDLIKDIVYSEKYQDDVYEYRYVAARPRRP